MTVCRQVHIKYNKIYKELFCRSRYMHRFIIFLKSPFSIECGFSERVAIFCLRYSFPSGPSKHNRCSLLKIFLLHIVGSFPVAVQFISFWLTFDHQSDREFCECEFMPVLQCDVAVVGLSDHLHQVFRCLSTSWLWHTHYQLSEQLLWSLFWILVWL